jgi:hypothetical protein
MPFGLGANMPKQGTHCPLNGMDPTLIHRSASLYEELYHIYNSVEVQRCLQVSGIISLRSRGVV